MPHKILIVAALGILSIGSAYALTTAHTFYEPAPDMLFANTVPTPHQSAPDTAFEQPRINALDTAPVFPQQTNEPLVIVDVVDSPNPSTDDLSTLEKPPRPIPRASNPDMASPNDGWPEGAVADSGVTQPRNSNRIKTAQKPEISNLRQANSPWTIGVFR